MELVLKAEWSQPDSPFNDVWELKIAGYSAMAYDRGDVWAWEVKKDAWATPVLYENWVDSEQEAKDAAEAAIRKAVGA